MNFLKFWIECLRVYSLPMSIMAWAIPFAYGCFHNGNVLYGTIALLGILTAHLGANLFDLRMTQKSIGSATASPKMSPATASIPCASGDRILPINIPMPTKISGTRYMRAAAV